jgi:hypothetical protein
MNKKLDPIKLYIAILLALFTLIGLSHLISCTDDDKASGQLISASVDIDYTKPIRPTDETMTMTLPCDSVYYRPVAWGSELRIVKNTLSSGNRRGTAWWQAKTMAWQIIDPTRYQQDSTRERVVIADRDTITYSDTFYICRKIRL